MNRANAYSLLVLLIPPCVLFGPSMVREETFAYRDSARFYHRQFEWNQTQWRQGEIPLWNPQENLGEPVVTESSSSVFYPLQALFLIPGLSFCFAFVLYAAIHVYLASIGSYFLARSLGCGCLSAVFCGISYSLCGSVIFQTCNIIFLVGASWLPFCVWTSFRLARNPCLFLTGVLAIFLSLPILGGDPQTTYHVGMIAAVWMIVKFVYAKFHYSDRPSNHPTSHWEVARYHLLAALLAIGITAVQILPSWHAAKNSTRGYFDQARSVWELSSQSAEFTLQGLYGHPTPGTHHDHIYQFSQAPWTIVELCWPNVTGHVQPEPSRWAESIPAASRTWTPSIYCGIITFVFFLAGFLRKSAGLQERWLKSCFLIFLLGSLGWFGMGWIWHEIGFMGFGTDPAQQSIGAPTGGIYWFFVVFLPGYVNFRYPAKLFVVASLFLCLIAAREFETRLQENQLTRLRRYFLSVVSASLVAMTCLWLGSIPFTLWLTKMAQTTASEFGPVQVQFVWSVILFSLFHSIAVCVISTVILNQNLRVRSASIALATVGVVDLLAANHSLILMTDQGNWQQEHEVAEIIGELDSASTRIFRTDPMTWSAARDWFISSSENRLGEIVAFENQTLMSKHHLGATAKTKRIGLVESFRSIEEVRFAALMAILKSRPGISTEDSFDAQLAPDPISLGVLSCKYFLIPSWGKPQIPADAILAKTDQYTLVRNPYQRKRFRVADQVEKIDAIEDLFSWIQQNENRKTLMQSSFGGKSLRPIVEMPEHAKLSLEVNDTASPSNRSPDDQVEILLDSNTQIELRIQSGGGLLVIADRYDQDWSAVEVHPDGKSTEIPIYRTNFVMRGIPLKGGETIVRLTYRPRWVIRGAIISCCTIFLLASMMIWNSFASPVKQGSVKELDQRSDHVAQNQS